MKLFNNITIEPAARVRPQPPCYFNLIADKQNKARVLLLFRRPGADADAQLIWSRTFASKAERTAVLDHIHESRADMGFWGRLVLAMGAAALNGIVDHIQAVECERLAEAELERLEKEADRLLVDSFVVDDGDRYYLTLQRRSDSKPSWSIGFRGRAERERLRDWFRWQQHRFCTFLDFADKHGDAALEKYLIAEMFGTERRIKQQGKSAGGTRPLRMWRGE